MTDPPQSDLIRRRNMVHQTTEGWRPPTFSQHNNRWAAAARRFLDLQAGSIWRDLKSLLPRVKGTIIDVGCGAQPYRSLVPPTVTYIGIDDLKSKDHFGYDIPDTRYFTGDSWPIVEASADFVLCTETLEHVSDTRQFLDEAFRCLVPGGSILITVPFAARWHFIPYDYWRFTPSGLEHLLRQAGFVNTRVYARGNAFTVACYKCMALLLRMAWPQTGRRFFRLMQVLLFLPFIPLLLIFSVLGNFSLLGKGGDDCLGYTAISERKYR